MKNENTADTKGVSTRHWMDKYGIKFEERLTVTKAQLELKMRPCFPLKTRIWAYLILHTAGYQGEHAQTLIPGTTQTRAVQPPDIADALQKAAAKYYRDANVLIDKNGYKALRPETQEMRRAIAAMEEDGICERRYKEVPLHKMTLKQRQAKLNGKIDLYVWLRPKKANAEAVRQEYENEMQSGHENETPGFSLAHIINHLRKESERISYFIRQLEPDKQETITKAWEDFVQVFNKCIPEVVTQSTPQVDTTAPPYIREEIEEEILEKETPPARPNPGIETGQAGGFPQFKAAVRKRFPSTSDKLISEIKAEAVKAYKLPGEITDTALAGAVEEAYFATQKTAHAFKTTVPRVIQTWVEEIQNEQKSA